MSGLTQTKEMPRSGRTLIAKMMKGAATGGISHMSIGYGPTGGYSAYGLNYRVGNNIEITGYEPVVVHNDFPVFNFGPEGAVGLFYFIDQVNIQADMAMAFGNDTFGPNTLRINRFNHLFLVHRTTSSGYGIADLFNAPTTTAVMPTIPTGLICYVGYIETDSSSAYPVKTIYNPARMFSEITRIAPSKIEYLGDRAINGTVQLELLQPALLDTTAQPNPSLLVRAGVSPGADVTVQEIAVFGNVGGDLLAWGPIIPGVAVTVAQSLFVRWAIGF